MGQKHGSKAERRMYIECIVWLLERMDDLRKLELIYRYANRLYCGEM